MGDVFPEIRAKQKHVEEMMQREEEAFNKTLDRGDSKRLFESQKRCDVRTTSKMCRIESTERFAAIAESFPARFAFELYDTYGFPLDLTELMARERGLTVDVAGFEKLMERAARRARARRRRRRKSASKKEN